MTTYIGTQVIAQWVGVFVIKCLNHFLYCNTNCNSVSRCVEAKCLYHHLYWNPDNSSLRMCVGDKMSQSLLILQPEL